MCIVSPDRAEAKAEGTHTSAVGQLFASGQMIERLKCVSHLQATSYRSIDEARKDIGLYLMDYYNWHRPHTANGGMAPAAAEEKHNLLSGIS
jgi:transposase InsO family protein